MKLPYSSGFQCEKNGTVILKKTLLLSALMAATLCFAQPADLVKSAEQGNAEAQNKLGFMLVTGRGADKNEAEAVQWYRKAAEQGYAEAQSSLGFMLANGRGVAKNEAEAVQWYRKSAEQGHAKAQTYLGFMLANGRGAAKNEAEAVQWYRKAAEQGYVHAQFFLGAMLAKGSGVAKNMEQAYFWLLLSAAQDSGSTSTREIVENELTSAQRSKIQEQASKWKPKPEN